MEIPTLQAQTREANGTRAARRLRRERLVPGVMYGRGEPNVTLTVERGDIEKMLADHHLIMRVECEDESSPVQLTEVQYDHLGDHIIHADFNRISLTESVQLSVPVETHGEAPGVSEGGMLEVVLHELQVECLPTAIPESIRVEIGELNIGDDVRVAALNVPEGVTVLDEADAVVLMVAKAPELIEEEEGEAEATAEPEVIGRAAELEEGEDAAGDKG